MISAPIAVLANTVFLFAPEPTDPTEISAFSAVKSVQKLQEELLYLWRDFIAYDFIGSY